MSKNEKGRLLVPEDFINSLALCTSNEPPEAPCVLTSFKCIPPTVFNKSELKEDKQESLNPLLKCFNPNIISFYNCFNKHANSNSNILSTKNTSSKEFISESFMKEGVNNSHIFMTSNFQSVYTEKSSGSLLTPENFLLSNVSEIKSVFPNVPNILETHKSSNDNKVQNYCCAYNIYTPQCDNNVFNISDKASADCRSQSDSERKIFTPDCFLKTSVRRKLDFNTPVKRTTKIREVKSPTQIDKQFETSVKCKETDKLLETKATIKKTNKLFETATKIKENTLTHLKTKENESISNTKGNFPKFSCSLDISDDVYQDFTINERKNLSENLTFKRKNFPPIGVFWDIENCQVPKGLSATHVVQAIRNRFFDGYFEAEFVCVCDTLKENTKILEELNDAQVNIMHVGSVMKNAADDKLLQSMRRFADIHGAGATIVLISGDADFATELYDLRYRKKLYVILVHNAFAQDSLKLSAHETVLFSDVTHELPRRPQKQNMSLSRDIVVWNLPLHLDAPLIKRRLMFLSSNCGGKKIYLSENQSRARISFNTPDLAARAKKRIDGEDVYGQTVNCTFGKLRSERSRNHKHSLCYSEPCTQKAFDAEEERREEAVHHSDSRRESIPNFDSIRSSSREELQMDIGRGYWNKSSGSSGSNTMNDNFNNTWRMGNQPLTHVRSFNSSPVFNSSESSSRETSPSIFLHNEMQGHSYHSHSPVPQMLGGCRTQSGSDLRSYDIRPQKVSHHWHDDRADNYIAFNYQADQSFAMNNLSLADTSQMPTIPINWGNMPSLPIPNQSSIEEGDILRGRAPVSIQTLEHFGKGFPPSANELPSPEYLTTINGDSVEGCFTESGSQRCNFGNTDTRGPNMASKNYTKKRMAAQFDTRE